MTAPVGRIPQQERSRVRYDRTLDAVGALLAATGDADVGLREIADRADVSVGWLYRFFPAKEAIVDAFLLRALGRLDDAIAALPRDRGVPALAESLVDAVVGWMRSEPGLPTAWAARRASPEVDRVDAAQNASIADVLAGAGVPRPRALAATQATEAVLELAFRHDPHGDADLVAEARRILRRALED